MNGDAQNTPNKNSPDGAKLSGEQRVAILARKLERLREDRAKRDRKDSEWMAEIERELEELKSSLTD